MFRLHADYLQRSAEVEVSDSLDTDSDVDVAMVDDMLSVDDAAFATEDGLPSVDDFAGDLPSVDDDGASATDVDLVDELLSVEDLLDDVLPVDDVASAVDVDGLRSLTTADPASASVVDATTVDLLSVDDDAASVDHVENLPSIGTTVVC